MAISNRERIARGIELLRDGLIPFVEREMRQHRGKTWLDLYATGQKFPIPRTPEGAVDWDTQRLLKLMIDQWAPVFAHTLGHAERSLVGELLDVRNNHAHEQAFNADDTFRALDSMQRLLRSISAATQAEALEEQKQEVLRNRFAEMARNKVRYNVSVEGKPRAGLRPWREIMTPHQDVASGRYMQAEFAADLAQVYRGEASEEYGDPVEFFRRTFLTEGLSDLLDNALRRLAGLGGDPVLELQTNFGGGKTHSMLALYHLFSGVSATSLVGLEPLIQRAGVERAVTAQRAVLVGTALTPGQATRKPDGTLVRTLWGELAWQLGGPTAWERIAECDQRGISPGSNDLVDLFRACGPCLILIDEWVAYARQTVGKRELPSGDFEAQCSFAQALTEAAKAVKDTLVVASVPASRIEVGGDNGQFALEALKNVFERLGTAWRPASADEGFEIVRRRLFETLIDKDAFAARDAVVDAFARLYKENAADFPNGCGEANYRRKLLAAYPFHPELFDRLYNDWSALDKFQRTRGVLRLLAKVVHKLWEGADQSLVILPSSVPMDDETVKSELTRYLEDNWEPILSHDVDGPDSVPMMLDRGTPNLGRYSAARRVARALYMGTAPGARGRNPGIDDRQVRLGCVQPGETTATFGDALRRLTDRATYLYVDGNRYWYSTQPSVTRLAEDRAAAIDPEEVRLELARRLKEETKRGDFAALQATPESTAEVPDEMDSRLVILNGPHVHIKGQLRNASGIGTDSPAMKFARELFERRGNQPRQYGKALCFLVPDKQRVEDLEAAVRQYLAWKSIYDQRGESGLNLDGFQQRQAESKMKVSDDTVSSRIRETWTFALAPHQGTPLDDVEWDEVRISGPQPLGVRTSAKLVDEGLFLPTMGANRLREALRTTLWADRNHVTVKQLWEYFARYLYLPRLKDRSTLAGAILNANEQLAFGDSFALAAGFNEEEGCYQGLQLGSFTKDGVSNMALVVKIEAARAQIAADEAKQKAEEEARTKAEKERTKPFIEGDDPQQNTTVDDDSRRPPVEARPETGSPVDVTRKRPRHFFGTVELDGDRLARGVGKVVEEVLQHMSVLPGVKVKVTLELEVDVKDGFSEDVVRTVSENCASLKFKGHGFEG